MTSMASQGTGGAVPPHTEGSVLVRMATGAWALALTMGALSILLGLAVVVWPEVTVGVVAVLFGLQLVFHGIFRIAQAIMADAAGSSRVLLAILGVLSLAIGVLALRNLLQTVAVLAILFGLFWLIAGVIEFVIVMADHSGAGKGMRLGLAAVSTLVGVLVLAYPDVSVLTLAWMLGLWLITWGILTIAFTLWLRRVDRAAGTPG